MEKIKFIILIEISHTILSAKKTNIKWLIL